MMYKILMYKITVPSPSLKCLRPSIVVFMSLFVCPLFFSPSVFSLLNNLGNQKPRIWPYVTLSIPLSCFSVYSWVHSFHFYSDILCFNTVSSRTINVALNCRISSFALAFLLQYMHTLQLIYLFICHWTFGFRSMALNVGLHWTVSINFLKFSHWSWNKGY